MRSWPLVALAALLMPAFGGGAQETPAPVGLLSDATGDLDARATTVMQDWSAPHFQSLDLVGLSAVETATDIAFRLKVASLAPPGEMYVTDDGAYYVLFTHNDQQYAVGLRRALAEQVYTWGFLLKFDPDTSIFNFQRDVAVTQDAGSNELVFSVSRQDLIDTNGAAPFPGRALTRFFAVSHLRTSQDPFVNIDDIQPTTNYDVSDRMPDTGEGAIPLPIVLGLRQSGHAALWSVQPMRASNGEATSFVFDVAAANSGDAEDLFELKASGIPRGWEVVIPDRYLRLAGGQSVNVPVVVSTPFSHDHGTVQDFLLEMQSQSDPASTGRLRLGVRYHAIPQPAGHHDTLYFHSHRWGEDHPLFVVTDSISSGNSGMSYLNTAEDDVEDQGVNIKGIYWGWGCHDPCVPDPPEARWRWFTYLSPGLEMGLDFDLARTGEFTFPIQSTTPIPQASMEGKLLHMSFDEAAQQWVPTVVATFGPTAPEDLVPNQRKDYRFDIVPLPAADLIPHGERVAFGLEMNLSSVARWPLPGFTGVEAPELVPGGWMRLPLFEYRDPIGDAFGNLADLAWMEQEMHAFANPAETVLFTAALHSQLDHEVTLDLALAGVHADWATLLQGTKLRLPAGGHVEVPVAVRVPDGAPDGDAADLVVTAQDRDEPTLRTLLRLVAVVDTDADHPDQSGAAAAQEKASPQESPAPTLALLTLALALLAARRRQM